MNVFYATDGNYAAVCDVSLYSLWYPEGNVHETPSAKIKRK